jgi:hypothetical protein
MGITANDFRIGEFGVVSVLFIEQLNLSNSSAVGRCRMTELWWGRVLIPRFSSAFKGTAADPELLLPIQKGGYLLTITPAYSKGWIPMVHQLSTQEGYFTRSLRRIGYRRGFGVCTFDV